MSDGKPEEKKDLTGILDLTKASQASISHMAGADVTPPLEQPKIEQVDSFESFDEFQKSGLTNPPPSTADTSLSNASAPPGGDLPPSTDLPPGDFPPSTDFATTPGQEAPPSDFPTTESPPTAFPTTDTFAPTVTGQSPPSELSPPVSSAETQTSHFESPPPPPPFQSETPQTMTPTERVTTGLGTESQLYPHPPASFGDTSTTSKTSYSPGIGGIKERSEQSSLMRTAILKPYDFILTGFLDPLNQSKIKDIVLKNNLGPTADDLTIQFKSGKLKLPRISEYVGIHLIQVLRDARVDMKLVPVNDADISQEIIEPKIYSHTDGSQSELSSSLADNIPITSGEVLPAYKDWEIVDTLTSSIGLTSEAIEVEGTDLYTDAVESLKREMRLRAFHKGASAIILFNVSMVRLTLPTHYKIFAVGTAINRIGTG